MEKAQSDAQALVSNFRAYSSTMVGKSKELAEQVNDFRLDDWKHRRAVQDLSMFDDYNPPPLRQVQIAMK